MQGAVSHQCSTVPWCIQQLDGHLGLHCCRLHCSWASSEVLAGCLADACVQLQPGGEATVTGLGHRKHAKAMRLMHCDCTLARVNTQTRFALSAGVTTAISRINCGSTKLLRPKIRRLAVLMLQCPRLCTYIASY